MGNGSGSASLSTSSSSAATSISPVGSSGFSLPGRPAAHLPGDAARRTRPAARAQGPRQRRPSSPRNTTWTTPLASRRSMKMTPPWSRRRATQPASMTVSPSSRRAQRAASWVRIINSLAFRMLIPNGPGGRDLACAAHSPRAGPRSGTRPARNGLLARSAPIVVAGPCPGSTMRLVRQRQADPGQAGQHRVVVAAGQVGAADRPREQQVAGEHHARGRSCPGCRNVTDPGVWPGAWSTVSSTPARVSVIPSVSSQTSSGSVNVRPPKQLLARPRGQSRGPGRTAAPGRPGGCRPECPSRPADRRHRPHVVDVAVGEQHGDRLQPVLGEDLRRSRPRRPPRGP